MKKIIILLTILFIVNCGNNQNELATADFDEIKGDCILKGYIEKDGKRVHQQDIRLFVEEGKGYYTKDLISDINGEYFLGLKPGGYHISIAEFGKYHEGYYGITPKIKMETRYYNLSETDKITQGPIIIFKKPLKIYNIKHKQIIEKNTKISWDEDKEADKYIVEISRKYNKKKSAKGQISYNLEEIINKEIENNFFEIELNKFKPGNYCVYIYSSKDGLMNNRVKYVEFYVKQT